MKQQVILLNGPSSSGKSTLAKALQAMIADTRSLRYEVISIDDFLPMTPTEPIYEDDVFAISGALCEKALAALEAGRGVILDHVITSGRVFDQLQAALSAYSVRLVRITCPLPVLRERESVRGDRCPGSAEASAAYLYPSGGYDLTVDTGEASPSENALRTFRAFFLPESVPSERSPSMRIRLEPITEENWLDVARLEVAPEQRGFLDTPLGILARGYVYREQRARVFAITADGAAAGVCLVKDLDDEPACYDLQQFLVDRRFRRRGVGTEALRQLLALLRQERRYDCVEVCVHQDAADALRLYARCGFADTGYVDPCAPHCRNLRYLLR